MYFQSLPYSPLRITSRFGPRNTGIAGASTYHYGIDLGADKSRYPSATYGGPLTSVLPGTVTTNSYNSARGYYVIINHGTIDGMNVRTLYQHLRTSGLSVGSTVRPGEWVGDMGATGTVSAVHLHFELHFNSTPVNPEPYLYDIREEQDEEEEQEMVYTTISQVPEWARPAIRTGVSNGWISTNAAGAFNVYESNLQTASWFYSTGLWDRQRPSSEAPSPWARDAVARAVNAGIIVGDGTGDLQLHTPITREESLVFLDRAGAIPATAPTEGDLEGCDEDFPGNGSEDDNRQYCCFCRQPIEQPCYLCLSHHHDQNDDDNHNHNHDHDHDHNHDHNHDHSHNHDDSHNQDHDYSHTEAEEEERSGRIRLDSTITARRRFFHLRDF